MKEYVIRYETRRCKNCNCAIIADSESEAWAKFVIKNIDVKYNNVKIEGRNAK